MEAYVRRFIRSSLIWLAIGVLIGLAMTFSPVQAMVLRPAHAHANLVGFVSMMIFGVAYHVLPRFVGRPLRSGPLAAAHLVVANAGLALLTAGWVARGVWSLDFGLVHAGGALTALGAGMFIYNIWVTLDGVPVPGRPDLVALAGSRGRET